jgi:hypothetical protein
MKTNLDFIEKGLDNAFKSLTQNLYGTINSTFTNFNNDYEKKVNYIIKLKK